MKTTSPWTSQKTELVPDDITFSEKKNRLGKDNFTMFCTKNSRNSFL